MRCDIDSWCRLHHLGFLPQRLIVILRCIFSSLVRHRYNLNHYLRFLTNYIAAVSTHAFVSDIFVGSETRQANRP